MTTLDRQLLNVFTIKIIIIYKGNGKGIRLEYDDKYIDDVKDLLTELEGYIVSIDKDKLDCVYPEYHEKWL